MGGGVMSVLAHGIVAVIVADLDDRGLLIVGSEGIRIEIIEDLHTVVNNALGATPDPRWRPMRTAPRDGTVLETLDCNREIEWVGGVMLAAMIESHDLIAWRPAHPEWNEEPS